MDAVFQRHDVRDGCAEKVTYVNDISAALRHQFLNLLNQCVHVVTPLQGYISPVTFTRGGAPGYRIMHLRCAGPEHIPDYNPIYSLALLI